VTIDERDYPMHVHIVSDTLMQHKLLIGADFLNSVQVKMNAGEITVNASESIPGNEEIREVCHLGSGEVNNMDETHVLNTEYQDATESLVDERKSEKTNCELDVLAMEEAGRS